MPNGASPRQLLARARSLLRGLLRHDAVEREIQAEFESHLAERADDLIREGVPPEEAERRARREFGHPHTHREQARDAMGLATLTRLRFSWIDVKVGLRMIRKHPMLNLAAIFALAVGIPVGLAPSHVARAIEAPLPGDPDDRIRAIRWWDPLSSGVAATREADFTFWTGTLRNFSSLGAYRASSHNVAAIDGPAAPAPGAQLSASIFPMLGVRPLLGRTLVEGDFAPDAPNVVVIGHGLWSSRFGRDPGVLGRSIRVGRSLTVVVGVMPPGFSFPNTESLWLPLRLGPVGDPDAATPMHVIGRLADGVSAGQAQAELSSLAAPPAPTAATPADARARSRLRPEVVPFGFLYLGIPAGGLDTLPEFRLVQFLMLALLLVACGNVAMLVFARTATRLRELAIRTSLGASRARLVSQIFVETLLLAVIAAGVGVVVFDLALDRIDLARLGGLTALPYWLSLDLTRRTALSAIGLAVVSATVAGVVPTLAITGRAIARNIRGASPVRMGRLTGVLMVADIAVSVAAVAMALAVSGRATNLELAHRATGIPAAEYLAVELRLAEVGGAGDRVGADPRLRRAAAQGNLVAALEREPGVRGVAVADVLPRMEHRSTLYELESAGAGSDLPHRSTRLARVDVDYFATLGTRIRAGRDFERSDVETDARVVIVNTAFAERALGGADPIGRRLRLPALSGASPDWHRIVGVVGPLGVNVVNPDRGEAIYLPAAPGALDPIRIAVHATVPPASLAGRVRELARQVDPDFVVASASALSEVRQGDWYLVMGLAAGLVVLVGVLLALATSSLYAMLSLSVSERTREIGIRAALGATRRALLLTILRRSLAQIAVGAAIGLPIAARVAFELDDTTTGSGSVAWSMVVGLALSAGIVVAVGLGSCLVPARRILGIQAREAMHADG